MRSVLQRVLDAIYRHRFSLLVGCIVVFVLADSLKNRDYVLPGIGERVSVAQPQLRSGHMFVATLSRSDLGVANAPVDAVLYEVTTRHGAAAFESIEEELRWSNAFYSRAHAVSEQVSGLRDREAARDRAGWTGTSGH